jgi:hypothetical protein
MAWYSLLSILMSIDIHVHLSSNRARVVLLIRFIQSVHGGGNRLGMLLQYPADVDALACWLKCRCICMDITLVSIPMDT